MSGPLHLLAAVPDCPDLPRARQSGAQPKSILSTRAIRVKITALLETSQKVAMEKTKKKKRVLSWLELVRRGIRLVIFNERPKARRDQAFGLRLLRIFLFYERQKVMKVSPLPKKKEDLTTTVRWTSKSDSWKQLLITLLIIIVQHAWHLLFCERTSSTSVGMVLSAPVGTILNARAPRSPKNSNFST